MVRFITLVLVSLLSLPIPAGSQSESAPYLYYYSDYLNAFVVERADGTDSRLLGQGLVPPGDNYFLGPGWSPSREWFAWTNFSNRGAIGGTGERTSYVISAHTGEPFEQVNGLKNAFPAWSPLEDMLLVIDPTDRIMMDAATVPHYIARISLIDMATQTLVTDFELDVNGTPKWADGTSEVVWSPDGQFAAFHYRPYIQPYQETYQIVSVTKAGNVQEQPVHAVTSTAFSGITPPNLPQGFIVRYEPDRQIIAVNDPISGETFEVDAPFKSDALWLTFDWNTAGEYALLDEYIAYPQHRLWLLSLPEKSLTLVGDTIWEASYFDPGENRNSTGNGIAGWSPDGRLAIYRSSENHFSILNPLTKHASEISNVRVAGYTVEVRWSIQGHTVTIGDANSLRIAMFNVDQKTVTLAQTDMTSGSEIVIYSPGGRYRSRGSLGQPLKTIDRLTDQPISFPVSGNATVINQNIRWHSDEEWLIKGDASYMTDGNGFRLIGVTNLTATSWRELGGCYFTLYCINWLPPQVEVSLLPPGSAESMLPAPDEIDYSVEFSFDNNEDDLVDLACDPDQDNIALVQDEMGDTQYTLRDALSCQGVIRKIHLTRSPDGTLLATAPQHGGRILLWDAKTGVLLARLNTEGYGVAFSEDGRKLYTRSWRALLTWDVVKIFAAPAP